MFPLPGLLCALTVLGGTPWAGAFRVTGHVGGNVSFVCSHLLAWRNTKFFCEASCSGGDVLVRSDPHHNPSVRGRYSLLDRGTGAFVVSVTRLRANDSGRYWCGVERGWISTYHQVDLLVSGAPAPTFYPVPTTPDRSTSSATEKTKTTEPLPVTTGTTRTTRAASTVSTTEHPENRQRCITVYIGVGLSALMVVLLIVLLTLLRLKRRFLNLKPSSHKRRDSAAEPFLPPGLAEDHPGTPGLSEAPDGLHYSIIDFRSFPPREPEPRGAPECAYATVKPAQSSAPVYAVVRKMKSPKTPP